MCGAPLTWLTLGPPPQVDRSGAGPAQAVIQSFASNAVHHNGKLLHLMQKVGGPHGEKGGVALGVRGGS